MTRIKKPECFFISGKSRTGKTYAAMKYFRWEIPGDTTSRLLDVYKTSISQLMGTTAFFNGYEGQEVIVLDEMPCYFGEAHRTCKILLDLMDEYATNVQIKGGHVPKRAWRIIVTTNYTFEKCMAQKPEKAANGLLLSMVIDYEGTYEPFLNRFTAEGSHPERIMITRNHPGQFPTVMQVYDPRVGALVGEEFELQQFNEEGATDKSMWDE